MTTCLSDQTLSDALAERGIRHEHLDGFRRRLYRGDEYMGAFDWQEAWALLAAPAAEDLTPEGVQLVIPGCEKQQPATMKQGELW